MLTNPLLLSLVELHSTHTHTRASIPLIILQNVQIEEILSELVRSITHTTKHLVSIEVTYVLTIPFKSSRMQIWSSNAHCGLLLSKTTNEHNAHPNYKFWHQSFFKRIMNETMLDAQKLYTFWTHIDYFASDTLFNISLLYHLM